MNSSSNQEQRYHRQTLLPQIGTAGQEKLSQSRVAILGCGALGTHAADQLARAGVGFLKIVDRDFVEWNNLQRQVLFDERDIAEQLPKAVAAKRKLEQINSRIKVEAVVADIHAGNAEGLIQDVDLVLDGLDNFETRFLVNEACVKNRKPWIYTGCVGTHGVTLTVLPGQTPCLRCVFASAPPPEVAPTCDTAGVLAAAVSMITAFQVTEAIKILTGNFAALNRSLYGFDIWTRETQSLPVRDLLKAGDCPVCGRGEYPHLSGQSGSQSAVLCGRSAVQVNHFPARPVHFPELRKKLEAQAEIYCNDYLMKIKIDGYEITLFPDSRAIIYGLSDTALARSLYAKYIGG